MPPSADTAQAPPPAPLPEPAPSPTAASAPPQPSAPEPDTPSAADGPAPPQPPLPPSDAPFTLPAIVHGIDADDAASPGGARSARGPVLGRGASGALSSAVTDVLSTISAGVQRAVGGLSAQPGGGGTGGSGLTSVATMSLTRRVSESPLPLPELRPAVLLFGDSLTARADHVSTPAAPGWAALLRETYGARASVALSGHSGYNTDWALYLLPAQLRALCGDGTTDIVSDGGARGEDVANDKRAHTDEVAVGELRHRAVVLFWGANDACAPGTAQHVPLDRFVRNLAAMVRAVRAAGATPVLISPPALGRYEDDAADADAGGEGADEADGGSAATSPDGTDPAGTTPPPASSSSSSGGRRAEVTKRYAEAAVKKGRELSVPVVDLHEAMSARAADDPTALDSLLCDGLHLSTLGNRLVFDLLLELFADALPHLVPAALPDQSPPWSDVDPACPAAKLGPCELAP